MNLQPVFQVSEFVEAANQHLGLLGEVVIEGEISRLDIKNGRLIFATVKDNNSTIDVFGLTHVIRNVNELEPGMRVHVQGIAGLYKGSGRFRLQANQITPHGEGSLKLAYEKLKMRLDVEGLFDTSHKRPLPEWPEKIGIITADKSSAYYDLVKIIGARMGGIKIIHLPVSVQGMSAVPTITKALKYVNQRDTKFDVVILSRGGGSLEDLQAFNDERIARAVFTSKVPIISAVGHEDDWSLTDYTADKRASTPSNAAELVVKDRSELLRVIDNKVWTINQQINTKLQIVRQQSENSMRVVISQISNYLIKLHATIGKVSSMRAVIQRRVNELQVLVENVTSKIDNNIENHISQARYWEENLSRLINSYNIDHVLKRGFSIARTQEGDIVNSVKLLKRGSEMRTTFIDGTVSSIVNTNKGKNGTIKD